MNRYDKQQFAKFREGLHLLDEAKQCFATGPFECYLQTLLDAHEYLVKRFSPYKLGDRIIFDGDVGIVEAICCDKEGFYFHVRMKGGVTMTLREYNLKAFSEP